MPSYITLAFVVCRDGLLNEIDLDALRVRPRKPILRSSCARSDSHPRRRGGGRWRGEWRRPAWPDTVSGEHCEGRYTRLSSRASEASRGTPFAIEPIRREILPFRIHSRVNVVF